MLGIVPLIILSLASYRITRFFVIDTLLEGSRNRFHSWLVNHSQKNGKLKFLWDKVYDWSSCTWCLGAWVSAALYWAYVWSSPATWDQYDVINIFAIAGIQGILHALEPGDE